MDIRRIVPEVPLAAEEVRRVLGDLPGGAPRMFRAISTDSRLCHPGDLFFALTGERLSGEDFVAEAVGRGAVAVSARKQDGAILVRDVRAALLALAVYYKEQTSPAARTVAVTGSYGKTTTKEFLAAILSQYGKVAATEGNFNNDIGVPLTLFSMGRDRDFAVIEAGMNRLGELSAISWALRPDLAIITGIGTAHIGRLGSREMIARAKTEITDGMAETVGKVLIPDGESLLDIRGARTVSVRNRGADFSLVPTALSAEGSRADFLCDALSLPALSFSLSGIDALECLAFAIAAAVLLGCGADEIRAGVASLRSPIRRIPEKVGSLLLLRDDYNASPESVLAAYAAADLRPEKPMSALLGDMEELGAMTEPLHRMIGAEAVRHSFHSLFLFGRFSPFIAAGALQAGFPDERIFVNTDPLDPEKTARQIYANIGEDELLLCKASHALHLSRVIDPLVAYLQLQSRKDGCAR